MKENIVVFKIKIPLLMIIKWLLSCCPNGVFHWSNIFVSIFWWWPVLSVVISRDLDQFILTHRHRKWSQTKWL